MEWFTVDFSQFPGAFVKIRILGDRLGACRPLQAFQGFS